MPVLVADIYSQDPNCSKPLRIQFSSVSSNNQTDCDPNSISTTCQPSAVKGGGWFYHSICADPNPAVTATKVFGNTAILFQTLSSKNSCSAIALNGETFPINTCIPLAYGNVSNPIWQGNMVVINPSSKQMTRLTFQDPNCTSTTVVAEYAGSIETSTCIGASTNTVLQYNRLGTSITSYMDRSCKIAISSTYFIPPNQCIESAECSLDPITNSYTTTSCVADTQIFTSNIPSIFNDTAYIIYSPFFDNSCKYPKPVQALLLNQCFPVYSSGIKSSFISMTKSKTVGMVDIAQYEDSDCKLDSVRANSYPLDGSCVGGVRVFLNSNGNPDNGTNMGNEEESAQSGTVSVNVLVGGVVGGLIGLFILGFAIWVLYKRRLGASKKDPLSRGYSIFVPTRTDTGYANVARASTEPFLVSLDGSDEKRGNHLFDDMNHAVATFEKQERPSLPRSDVVAIRTGRRVRRDDVETAYFGYLCLPSIPSEWTIGDVADWVALHEGTEEIVEFVEDEEIDGRALMKMDLQGFSFPSMESQLQFQDALSSLIALNEQKRAARESLEPPPLYHQNGSSSH